jgi:hypothetical protein
VKTVRVRPSLSFLALGAVLLVYAFPTQGQGSPPTSHYALVKSLARGTPYIDETRFETGDIPTADYAYRDGHYYSNKAPGLAFLVLPVYLAFDALGFRTTGDPTQALWVLGLVGAVLPTLLLLVLLRRVCNRIESGFGTAAAVTIGLGTLFLPYGTMLFAHSLSAALGFAAFVLLWHEREGATRLLLLAAAGLLAGIAVTVEYPLALFGFVLGAYAVCRRDPIRRALAYAAGVAAGVAPLLLYHWWAFGSPTTTSYSAAILLPGETGHERVAEDLGPYFGTPTIRSVVFLLFSRFGFLTLSPVLAAGIAALIVLYRRGWRAEALTILAVSTVYVVYVSGLVPRWGLGQAPPGARFLVPLIPFVGVPLALAYRRFPLPTAALAAASTVLMLAFTTTHPLAAWDGQVLDRLFSAGVDGYSATVPALVAVTGWYDVLPMFAAAVLALVFAVLATPRPSVSLYALASALFALVAWGGLATSGANAFERNTLGAFGGVALVVLEVAVIAAVLRIHGQAEPRAGRALGGG